MKALLRQGRGKRWQVQVFLDIFAGSGGVARKLRGLNFLVLEIDINKGAAWDVTRPAVQKLIRGWLAAGLVWGVHLATPCNSMSHARDRGPVRTMNSTGPGWPGRLRSRAEPWGLKAVTHLQDRKCMAVGNCLAKFSAALMEATLLYRIPIAIENPASSWLWSLPPFLRLARRREWSMVTAHFCAFGARWRKPTMIAGFFTDLAGLDKRCRGRIVCEHSDKPHLVLAGRSADNCMMTKIAESYPRRFATALAQAHASAKAQLWMRHIIENTRAFKAYDRISHSYVAPARPIPP